MTAARTHSCRGSGVSGTNFGLYTVLSARTVPKKKETMSTEENKPKHNPQRLKQVKSVNYPDYQTASLAKEEASELDGKTVKIRKRQRGFDVVAYEKLPAKAQQSSS